MRAKLKQHILIFGALIISGYFAGLAIGKAFADMCG